MSMRAKWKRTKSVGKEILLSRVQRGCYKQDSGGKKRKEKKELQKAVPEVRSQNTTNETLP